MGSGVTPRSLPCSKNRRPSANASPKLLPSSTPTIIRTKSRPQSLNDSVLEAIRRRRYSRRRRRQCRRRRHACHHHRKTTTILQHHDLLRVYHSQFNTYLPLTKDTIHSCVLKRPFQTGLLHPEDIYPCIKK